MKKLLLVLCALSSASALADKQECFKAFRAVVSEHKAELNTDYPNAKAAMEKAILQYQTQFEGSAEGEIFVDEQVAYFKRGALSGYKIAVTDGGDESLLDCFFDRQGNLLRTYWHNQSPEETWVCEGYED